MIGKTLGQYEILEEIGRGGMACIYKAYQASLDRVVAIKVLSEELCDRLEFVERFHREATAIARLTHPNIVHIIDRGEEVRKFYFVMEYVEGTTLKDMLAKGPISLPIMIHMAKQICSGLAYAHSQGVIHRDIKPGNILVDKREHVKITDFGIAQITALSEETDTLTREQSSMGTADYMAPEQRLDARNVDKRADLYSLGVVLYQMGTGRVPMGAFAMPSAVNANLPKFLNQIILKCLQEDMEKRYKDAEEIFRDLDQISVGVGGKQSTLFFRSRPLLIAGLGVMAALLVLVAVLFLRKGLPEPEPSFSMVSVMDAVVEEPYLPESLLTPSLDPSPRISITPQATVRMDVTQKAGERPEQEATKKIKLVEKTEPDSAKQPKPSVLPTEKPVSQPASISEEQPSSQEEDVLGQAERKMTEDREAGLALLRQIAQEKRGLPLAAQALLLIARNMERDALEGSKRPLISKARKRSLWDPVLQAYEAVIVEDSDGISGVEAWSRMGKIYTDMEEWDQALDAWAKVIQHAPEGLNRTEALASSAQLCEKLFRFGEAIAYYEQVMAEHPGQDTCALLFSIAEIYENRLKDPVKSLDAYRKAAEVCQGTPNGEKALQKVRTLSQRHEGKMDLESD